MKVRVKRIDGSLPPPAYETSGSVGFGIIRRQGTAAGKAFVLAVVALLVLVFVRTFAGIQPTACTAEALICPDGSGVGRVPPDCRFAPCPDCTCPAGFIQEGDTCNPACYYASPKCLLPSVLCTPVAK